MRCELNNASFFLKKMMSNSMRKGMKKAQKYNVSYRCYNTHKNHK